MRNSHSNAGEREEKGRVRPLVVVAMILCILLFILSAYLTWVSFSGTGTGEMPNIFGWSAYISDGTYSTIPKDAAVLTQRDAQFEAGDTMIYLSPDRIAESTNRMTIGLVKGVAENGAVLVDSENGEVSIQADYVRGKAVSYVGFVGKILGVAQGEYGQLLTILLSVFWLSFAILCGFKCRGKVISYFEEEQDVPRSDYRRERQMREPVAFAGSFEKSAPYREEPREDAADFAETEDFEEPVQEEFLDAPLEEMPAQSHRLEAQIEGSPEEKTVVVRMSGPEAQIKVLAKLIDLAIKKKGSQVAVIELTPGQPAILTVKCAWQDVELVSRVVAGIQQRAQDSSNQDA